MKKRYYKKSSEQAIFEGFFKGLWWLVSLPFRLIFSRKKSSSSSNYEHLDQTFIENKWQEIEQLMSLGRPSNYSRAVLEADKLLDHVLKGLRAPGLTMGDRLKASKNRFSYEGYDSAWKGHKVRNEVVHNVEYQVTDFMAKEAISNFKRALEELVNLN